jgi:DNA-binding CsgD family transcriptional regulator
MDQKDILLIKSHAKVHLALSGSLILVLCLFLWLCFAIIFKSNFLEDGQTFVIIPIILFWIWILRNSPREVLKIFRDIKSKSVDQITGKANTQLFRGIGIIAPLKQKFSINGETLKSRQDLLYISGNEITARYAPESKILLSFEFTNALDEKKLKTVQIQISEDEADRLNMLAQGLSDKLIARKLDLSPSTVRTYNSRLFKKIGASNRRNAVIIARQNNWINVD